MADLRKHRRHLFGLAAAILVVTGAVTHGASWSPINTGLPSAVAGVTALTTDPTTPSTLYVLTDSGAVFKSTDGGGSWKPRSGVVRVNSLTIDPKNSSTIYAATNHGVVKSTDGGESWDGVNNGLTNSYVSALAVDPVTPSTLYSLASGSLFKSTNGGGSWSSIDTFPPNTFVGSLAIDPITPSTMYAAVSNGGGIFKSTDAGESWIAIRASVASIGFSGSAMPLAIDPVTPSTIYAGSFAASSFSALSVNGSGSISKSTDGGRTWSAIRAGIPAAAFVRSLAIDPTDPTTIYGGYVGDDGWGIIKSADGGQSWNVMKTGFPSGAFPGFLIALVAINPGTPSTIYAGYFDSGAGAGGLFKSTDGGASWNAANAGLAYFDTRVLALDPVNAATVYTGGVGGVFKSGDPAAGWTHLSSLQISAQSVPPGVPASPFGAGSATIRSLLIDSTNPDLLYVGAARGSGCAFNDKVVFKSADDGSTWSDSVSPPDSGCLLSGLLGRTGGLLATHPTDANTVYAGETDDEDGIFSLLKSSDGGANWSPIWDWRNGLESGVNALLIDPANPATLYAGIGDKSLITPGATASGLFKSTDGGANWNNIGLQNSAVTALAMDPEDPSILYAGTEGIYTSPNGFRGLFKSTDSGASWFAINRGLATLADSGATIAALAIAPNNSNILYAGTSGGGVYKSLDGGSNWVKFNDGLTNLDIRALAIVPGATNTLYAATSGGIFKMIDASQ